MMNNSVGWYCPKCMGLLNSKEFISNGVIFPMVCNCYNYESPYGNNVIKRKLQIGWLPVYVDVKAKGKK